MSIYLKNILRCVLIRSQHNKINGSCLNVAHKKCTILIICVKEVKGTIRGLASFENVRKDNQIELTNLYKENSKHQKSNKFSKAK